MIGTPGLQAKDVVAMSIESTRERGSAPAGLELEERSFPGLTAPGFSVSPLRGAREQALNGATGET